MSKWKHYKIQRYELENEKYLEFSESGWWVRHRDHQIIIAKARAEALEMAAELIETSELAQKIRDLAPVDSSEDVVG